MKVANKVKFENGVSFEFEGDETYKVDLSEFSSEMLTQLAVHGLAQKLGDSYSNSESVHEAVEKFYGVLNNLREGVWNPGRSATSGGIWVEAIARASGKPLAECAEMYSAKSKEEQKAIRKNKSVDAAKRAITIEREQAKLAALPQPENVDVDELFA